MVDFDRFVVMQEEFVNKLNLAVDEIINEKMSMKLDYDFIEKSLKPIIQYKNINDRTIPVVTKIKKEYILKIALLFFESVDSELYKKALDIILGQEKDIAMKMYNVHFIKNFKKKDEKGFLEYTPYGVAQTRKGEALINIPTNTKISKEEDRIINENNCSLEDLYTVVHEISHMFDLNLEIGRPTKNEIADEPEVYEDNITRELTAEATAIAFERLLSEYLLERKLYPKLAIQQIDNGRTNSCLQKARMVYAKLVLAKEKEQKGEITLDFVEKCMRDYHLSIQGVRYIARSIINSKGDLLMQNRYAMGGFIAPTIIKTYKIGGATQLKKYLEEAKKCNLESTLKQIGIQFGKTGINEAVKNFQEYMQTQNLYMDER